MKNNPLSAPNYALKQPKARRFLMQTGAISIVLNTNSTEKLTDLEKFIVELCEVSPKSTITNACVVALNQFNHIEKREYHKPIIVDELKSGNVGESSVENVLTL